MNRKIILPIFFALFLFMIPSQQAQSLYGSAGSLEVGATSGFDGGQVAVRCYDLTDEYSYKVNSTGDDTGFTFYLQDGQTEYTVYLNVDKPASSETVYITLWGSNTGSSGDANGTSIDVALDIYTIQVKDDSIIPDEFLISLGITLLVLGLIVGIVQRIRS